MKTVFVSPVFADAHRAGADVGRPLAQRPLRLMSLATLALALTGALLLAATPQAHAQAQPAPPAGAAAPQAQHAAHHRMGAGMAGAAMMSGRLLDAVGASTEQKTRVQEILKTAHDDIRKQHDGDRELQQQLVALLAAPQVDAAAAEGVRQKLQARHDSASKRRLQAMLDAGAVLTPEQRQKVAERLKSRGEMMQRHQRERQAAEPRS